MSPISPTKLPTYEEVSRAGWMGGRADGTECGRGSTLENTQAIRSALPMIVWQYGIRSVCDAGAGDLHWMQYVDLDVVYTAYDLIPRHPSVHQLDITRELLPKADMILCRWVLGHLGPAEVHKALALFRRSGSTYLMASNPQQVDYDVDCYGTFNKWDLKRAPFSLGEPLECIEDTLGHDICLWKL